MNLERRLAQLVATGVEYVTADDITNNGALTVDNSHGANGKQSTIGSAFRTWAARGWIKDTGRHIKSQAPHRKGGVIRVWKITDKGRHALARGAA